jgi:LPS-assembly protein
VTFRKRNVRGTWPVLLPVLLLGIAGPHARARTYHYYACPALPLPALPSHPNDARIRVRYDRGIFLRHGISHLYGHIVASQLDRRLWMDRAQFNRRMNILHGSGHVRFAEPDLYLEGPTGSYDFTHRTGAFSQARYFLPLRHGHGRAKRILVRGSRHAVLHGTTYTTCPPGQPDWELHASRVNLHLAKDTGYAYNAWLTFYRVPILYTPFLTFPLSNKRKSGFLPPRFGTNSLNGTDLEIPYYFNLAPNYDLTLSPRWMSKRGVLTGLQLRYLTPTSQGILEGHYLPHDNVTGTERSQLSYNDTTIFNPHTSLAASYNYLSDPEYLIDFGTSLVESAQPYQFRNLTLTYARRHWSLSALGQVIQTVDPTIPLAARPYREIPLLSYLGRWGRRGWIANVRGGFGRFEAPGQVSGDRLHLLPSLGYRFGNLGASLTPRVALDGLHYWLAQPVATGDSKNPSMADPIYDIDARLRFERRFGHGRWLQTFEPRLFYLYVPYRNQSAFPVFDTSEAPFDTLQLFSTNRFLGPDRLENANQITAGFTSRLLRARNGDEIASFTLGQIFYFQPRQVTLPGQTAIDNPRSAYAAEARINLGRSWSGYAAGEWDPYGDIVENSDIGLEYHPRTDEVFNLGYTYEYGALDQTNLSFVLPIGSRWSVVGLWDYSIFGHTTLETFAGIQYDTCCWIFRILDRRFVVPSATGSLTSGAQTNSAVYFELTLKGLGSLGHTLLSLLRQDIAGYEEPTNQ